MIRTLIAFTLFAAGALALAAEAASPAGLLPDSLAQTLLQQDPAVAAARTGLQLAGQDASLLDRSPYEPVLRAASQQRRASDAGGQAEWELGVEQTLRLPAKADADRRIGHAGNTLAQAQYGEVLHESARQLLTLWLDWQAAGQAEALAVRNTEAAAGAFAAVDKRYRAGDASRLELNLARSEELEQRRLENEARSAAAAAWIRLSQRYPGVPQQPASLAPPPIGEQPASFWLRRIVEQSDRLKVADARLQLVQAQLQRAGAERYPDPTLGVFHASEAGGRDRISGISISVPFAPGLRAARNRRAETEVAIARQQLEQQQRLLESEVASAVRAAEGSLVSLTLARQSAAAMQANADQAQRAYSLGEIDLQSLLQARRLAIQAASNALSAQLAAWKAGYGLMVDAHLVWGLAHD